MWSLETPRKNPVARAMMRECGRVGERPSNDLLQARDRVMAAEQTPNMVVLGDPPLERSALWQKLQKGGALVLVAVALAAAIATVRPADAHWRHHHMAHRYAHYLTARHFHYRQRYQATRRALPGPCRVAASMGGPCGCWAAYVLLGRLDHVWRGINLWLANDWLRFPHVAAAPGTAAVWPGRHVAPVVSGPHPDRTVTVRDSWAVHRVRMAGLVFVQPPSTSAPARHARGLRWVWAAPL